MKVKRIISVFALALVVAFCSAMMFVTAPVAKASETALSINGMYVHDTEPAGLMFETTVSNDALTANEKFGTMLIPVASGVDLSGVTISADEVASNANVLVIPANNWLTENTYSGVLVGKEVWRITRLTC